MILAPEIDREAFTSHLLDTQRTSLPYTPAVYALFFALSSHNIYYSLLQGRTI